ncbi:MAG: response regulator [Deltaproteobacteria bacterium]|nr:response regulator [Deltaproteobacteria bacterium]
MDEPLYNSRLLRHYIEYVRGKYPAINIPSMLSKAGITLYEVEDQGHWFDQDHVNRLHEVVTETTGDHQISRKVGRYSATSQTSNLLKQYALALLTPASVYKLLERFQSNLTRATHFRVRQLARSKMEIQVIPEPGVHEMPFQCENRIGMLESVAKLFTGEYAKIEHTHCVHRNDEFDRYIISWETPLYQKWRLARNYYAIISFVLSAVLLFFLPMIAWTLFVLVHVILIFIAWLRSDFHEKRQLAETVKAQGDAAVNQIDEMNIRYNNALLIGEIGHATSSILSMKKLLKSVAEAMQKRLDFDRGLILLADENNRSLKYAAGYGYMEEEENLLSKTGFNLENLDSKGVFVMAFHRQQPFMINNMEENGSGFSQKSLELARKMKVRSLICVPIVYERESLGILAVDNVRSNRALTQSDVNLLMGVASQTAISLVNARSFQQLRKSERKYRDLVENANSIIMRMDTSGNITFFNAYAQRFFQYSEAEVLGKNVIGTIIQRTPKESRTFEQLIKRLLMEPERSIAEETQNIIKDGHQVWVSWTYKPISENGLNFSEILCIGNNISELKKAQEEQRELEARLQRAQKMEALGTLAGGVAHDLNNILSGLVGYPELLLMDLPPESRLRKSILMIQKSGEKAARVVQDLLTLARRGVAVTEVANLNQIIADYLQSPEFNKLIEYHPSTHVRTNLDQDLLNIMGSPIHLSKTIMNLVSNAAEAMPDGGNIDIITENQYVEYIIHGYESIERGDYVVLQITDTGGGISPSDRERIFEPFYSKKVMGRSGTGLGMAVVWGTVKDHKGYIDLQSEEGKGTTFTIYFPATRQELQDKTQTISLEEIKGKGQVIAVVDDVKEQREIAKDMLERLEYEVITLKSGEEAVEYLRDHSADLLVLDMIMDPGIDGYETYKRILEIHPKQKAIITSGFSESERVMEARKLGVGNYVEKPYLIEKLGLAIKRELER